MTYTDDETRQSLHTQVLLDVARALQEDVGSGDLTAGLIDPARRVRGRILVREAAVLCGTPNRGTSDWPESRNREFNGKGPFLTRLNGGTTDVVPETDFLTIRSAWNDVYAQPRAIWSPTPDRPTGTDVDGPELREARHCGA